MTPEEKASKQLINRFPELSDKILIARTRRMFADVPENRFLEILDYVLDEIGFPILCLIIGLDQGEQFELIYVLSSCEGCIINLKRHIPRETPVIQSVYDRLPNSEIYERELVDLFGITVHGLPDGARYPLPDDWPEGQYPLRKDWKPEMLDQREVAHNG
ncbi:MAG: NADH-quinone oxidoreductase subunit C [Desulfuromonadales bacterium]|nr:NADH-quinone oxidoreductase subunit C [Desulfuromonadales bacterium]